MDNLLFFYAVQGEAYHQFVLPFLYFAKKYNPGAKFEIVFVNEDVPEEILIGCKKCNLDRDVLLRRLDSNYNALTVRWLVEPVSILDYTYIGDIDIMITESVSPFHLQQMRLNGSCYSNTIRSTNVAKMSGLQFVSREWYSKIKSVRESYLSRPDLFAEKCNEAILKKIIAESKLPLITEPRPDHGVHISLNRKPFAENSPMKNAVKDNYRQEFFSTLGEEPFQSVLDCSPTFKKTLDQFVSYVKEK